MDQATIATLSIARGGISYSIKNVETLKETMDLSSKIQKLRYEAHLKKEVISFNTQKKRPLVASKGNTSLTLNGALAQPLQ